MSENYSITSILKFQELIPVKPKSIGEEEINSVDARDLHEFLKLRENFNEWIKRYLSEYGFVINSDFCRSLKIASNGRKIETYFLSIDMAKEMSMISKTKRGKEVRKYFIECERKSKHKLPGNFIDALKALVVSEEEKQELILKIKRDRPAVEFKKAVMKKADSVRIGEYAKMLSNSSGIKIGPNKLMEYFRDYGYLMTGRDEREKNKPYQTAIQSGLFEFKVEKIKNTSKTACVTYVTGKGQYRLKTKVLKYFR